MNNFNQHSWSIKKINVRKRVQTAQNACRIPLTTDVISYRQTCTRVLECHKSASRIAGPPSITSARCRENSPRWRGTKAAASSAICLKLPPSKPIAWAGGLPKGSPRLKQTQWYRARARDDSQALAPHTVSDRRSGGHVISLRRCRRFPQINRAAGAASPWQNIP